MPGFDKDAFKTVHQSGHQITSVRINPSKPIALTHFSYPASPIPWCASGFYLEQRPSFTFDPLFHAGCYYVQEASSMFLEQAMRQLTDLSQPLKVLDVSAAPGGKSTHLQSLISSDSLLVSNEVIRSRCAILTDNIIKWGAENVVVTNNDPSHFKKLSGYFDVIVVDAPCSGSGLFRKDPEAIQEWSLNNVALCSQRQQRILADVLPCLKQNGLLIYSTCSYSVEEDEGISDWLTGEMGLQSEAITIDENTGIVETIAANTGAKGYRFYPHRLKGEGFFLACFRKTDGEGEFRTKPIKWERASAKEKTVLEKWLSREMECIRDREIFYALPASLSSDIAILQSVLKVQYKGVRLGQIMKDKLVPDHALALSSLLSDTIPFTEVDEAQAIKYLQRADLDIQTSVQGWQTIVYQNHRLGWINALSNRINNYYPKEMRILKRENPQTP